MLRIGTTLLLLLSGFSICPAQPQQDAPPSRRSKAIVAAADVPGWTDSRFATARLPQLANGTLADLFDRNPLTAASCAAEGPAIFEFYFREPVEIHQVGVTPGRGAAYRWDAHFASAPDHEGRFAFEGLVGRRDAAGGRRDPVRLPESKPIQGLRFVVERMTNGSRVQLAEIEIYAAVAIDSFDVAWPGLPLVAGGAYTIDVIGRDDHGGSTRLENGIRWALFPQKNVIAIAPDGRLDAVAPGKVEVRVAFGDLHLEPKSLIVVSPPPAPGPLEIEPFRTTAAIRARFAVGPEQLLLIYRREEGQPVPETPLFTTPAETLTDFDLLPDARYLYSARVVGAADRVPVTERTAETLVRTLDAAGAAPIVRAAGIEALVIVYAEGIGEDARAALLQGIQAAQAFLYRNTLGRLSLQVRTVFLDAPLPGGNVPLLDALELDLAARGLLDHRIRFIHVMGAGAAVNWGGARLDCGTTISFGCTASAASPLACPPAGRDACWTFIHELQHSIAAAIDAEHPEAAMLHGHLLENYPLAEGEVLDAGEAYDGQAAIWRRYTGFDGLPQAWCGRLETADSDGDGLPDADDRWPADEARLGTDPAAADSDGDGLGDLAEYCAGIYRGADPRAADTDGDGIPDGRDPFPLSAFTGLIPFGESPAEETLPGAVLSRGVFFQATPQAPSDVVVSAAWCPGGLFIGFDAGAPLEVRVHLDGSGRLGPFQSDAVTDDSAGSGARGDVYTAERALRAGYGEALLFKGNEPVDGGRVASWRSGERWRLLVAVPAALGGGTSRCFIAGDARPASGLTLRPGRVVGLNFTVRAIALPGVEGAAETGAGDAAKRDAAAAAAPGAAPGESEFAGDWSAVYEIHRFYDAVLGPAE